MTLEELLNINSSNPDPLLLKKALIEYNNQIQWYMHEYTTTKKRYWLGKTLKYRKWVNYIEIKQNNL